ncbi:hypothetical protein [Streptomyces sp. A1547]|uniref:Uncharacterized protein n=1 Tax=Streptomyces sp. R33 TaxID=3238629 RepID=A0AB39Y5K1_9ACTN|nr:hypothetical protein [Streptomyces sp. A1547]
MSTAPEQSAVPQPPVHPEARDIVGEISRIRTAAAAEAGLRTADEAAR